MTITGIGIIVSFLSIVLLSVLFEFEKSRKRRVLERFRSSLDAVVIYSETRLDVFFKHLGGDLGRQLIHYFFDTVLIGLLHVLRKCEKHIRVILRSNYLLAKKARTERTSRNKLDEIAEHKMSTALSDEEKRKHREMMLNG